MKLFIYALITFTLLGRAAEPEPAKFHIHTGSIKRTYACAPGVEAGDIPDGVVHANLRRGDNRYLLIAYSEPSRPGSPNKRCGGGIESYLVWLHIRGTTVLASQSTHYASCWEDIDGGQPEWSGQFCIVKYERFIFNQSSLVRSKASFDSKAPEKGIQVADEPPEPVK